jgi:sugar transferase (PEP-CTERM/EpsH1 system associated)
MRELLFLAHRVPYPPNKGDKIRAWHILRHLAQSRRVHLGCFIDDEKDWEQVPRLREMCGETHFARLDRRWATTRALGALVGRAPLTLPYYRDPGLARWVAELMQRKPIPVFVFSSAMAQYVADVSGPRIIDFVDVDSEKWRAYAEQKSWPIRSVYAREATALQSYERRVAGTSDASLFVSEAEAALFRALAPESGHKTYAIGNGVDCDFFKPGRELSDPYDGAGSSTLCFTGMMDYWPNIDAVVWFAERVLPILQRKRPGTRFCIVGANPSREVNALAERPGILVTGRVPDTRPFLQHAAAVVAPLRIARGIQNKVLEAMAMGRPVVATSQAFEGIDAVPGRDLMVADSEEGFAEAAIGLLEAGAAIGAQARRLVENIYGWPTKLAPLDAVLAAVEGRSRTDFAVSRRLA